MNNAVKIEFLIAKIGNLWRKNYNRSNKRLGLSVSERRVLVAIDIHPGLAQSAIALYLDMEPQNLLRLIDRLEENEFLERNADKNDRRVKTLHILPAGKKIVKEIYRVGDQFRDEFLKGINKDKLATTEAVLKQIEDNLLASTYA